MADLKGKVVLVNFWTYSCINVLRTLPHLIDWNTKYADKGSSNSWSSYTRIWI